VQSPSSLIFLVLLGVWAAYFVQYWVRRRDHVATARSVEQFSEAMRVLERRDPLPRTDFSEPAPRSYAVHPARAARPQVLVKRAVAAEPGAIGVTERIADVPDAAAPAAAAPAPSAPSGPSAPSAPAARVPARPRVRPSRRVRGLLFLAAVAELLVILPLVTFGMLPLWAMVPALLAVGCALLFVRSGARTERALVRAQRRRQAGLERLRASAPVASRPAAPSVATTEATAAAATGSPVVADDVSVVSETSVVPEVAVAEPAADQVVAVAQPAADVMVPIVDDDDIPLTWDPVPVPRPTYTMKAKAPRAEVAPAAVTPDPVPVVRESPAETYDERRVAGA
jgi:hypothetical protein